VEGDEAEDGLPGPDEGLPEEVIGPWDEGVEHILLRFVGDSYVAGVQGFHSSLEVFTNPGEWVEGGVVHSVNDAGNSESLSW